MLLQVNSQAIGTNTAMMLSKQESMGYHEHDASQPAENATRHPRSEVPTTAILHSSYGLSSKMDFGNDGEVTTVTNTTKVEDEDVEVKHTIVVSTKLRNNNRRGLHAPTDGDGILTYSVGTPKDKDDSGEVPIVPGYKSVESTRIRTPDSRLKSRIYPDSVFMNRNIRDDELHIVPNLAANPMQWKPSSFYNNINWWSSEGRQSNFARRSDRPFVDNNIINHRKITNDGLKEFYCRKCHELSSGQPSKGCAQQPQSNLWQQRSNPWMYETTTPKMKLDGKLAKLN